MLKIILSFFVNIINGVAGNYVYDKLINWFGKGSKSTGEDTSKKKVFPDDDDVIDVSDIIGFDENYEKELRDEKIRDVASNVITFVIIFSLLAMIIFLTVEFNKWLQTFYLPVYVSIPCALQIVLYLPTLGLHFLNSEGKIEIISAFLTLACLSIPVGIGIWLWSKGTRLVPAIFLPVILSVIMLCILHKCKQDDE